MADDRVIDAYLLRLAAGLPGRRSASSLAEIEDHLHEHADHLMSGGCDRAEAERRAVSAFGDPELIAQQLVVVGGGRPSKFSSWSGLFGMIGPVMAVTVALLTPPKLPGEGDPPPPFTFYLVALCLLLGALGVVIRTRGAFGRWSGASIIVVLAAAVALFFVAPYGKGGIVVAALLLLALVLLCEVILREAVLPRPATVLLLISIVTMSALAPTSLAKESMPYDAGLVVLFVGWLWLQYTLWSERPDRSRAMANG